jgi:hypothetical protein
LFLNPAIIRFTLGKNASELLSMNVKAFLKKSVSIRLTEAKGVALEKILQLPQRLGSTFPLQGFDPA